MPRDDLVKMTFYLPAQLARRLRVTAAQTRISQSALVARGLEKELRLHEPRGSQGAGDGDA